MKAKINNMLKFRVRKEANDGRLLVFYLTVFYMKIIHHFFFLFQGDPDVNNNPFIVNGNNHLDKNLQV
jgi:hypothetical protein